MLFTWQTLGRNCLRLLCFAFGLPERGQHLMMLLGNILAAATLMQTECSASTRWPFPAAIVMGFSFPFFFFFLFAISHKLVPTDVPLSL